MEVVSVGEREPLNTRVDVEVRQQFREFTEEKKGKVRGEMGRLVERAMLEYMDRDRYARVEEKLDEVLARLSEDGNTRTQTDGGQSPTMQRLHEIADRLRSSNEHVVEDHEVEQMIVEVAGGDDRTVEKYRERLKNQGLLYQHPHSRNWFFEPRHLFAGLSSMTDPRPVLEQYPDEFSEEFGEYLNENED